ncbi:zf-HC2 domain-containing protein [Paenibacillus daejeonensis]|uniref:zf-HC2 domain-containing protein n=1 Tax=Paenibacillus daejeonensis TaxID=135193 RepID=UPI0003668278|nr:zf-HC2 domain-containing protein [Paenibacillus daejeonensis]
MTCQEVMDYMQRQLDGDLDERETDILHKHTRHCPDCAAMLERLQRLSGELDSLPKVTPPFSLVDAILPQLDEIEHKPAPHAAAFAAPEEASRRVAPTDRRKGWLDRLPLRTLSGVVAASIVAGLFIFNYSTPSPSDEAAEVSTFQAQTGDTNDTGAGSMNGSGEMPGELEGGVPDGNEEMGIFVTNGNEEPSATNDSVGENASGSEEPSTQPAPRGANELTPNTDEQATPAEQGKPSSEKSLPNREQNAPESGQKQDTRKNSSNANSDEPSAGMMSEPESAPPVSEQPSMDQPVREEMLFDFPMDMAPTFDEELPSASDVARGYAQADTVASPDGQMKAAVQSHVLQIYGSDGMLIFESRKQPGSSIQHLSWSSDSQTLSYELHGRVAEDSSNNNGVTNQATSVERYVVNIKDGTETKQ